MVEDSVRFLLTCAARTGSSMVISYLQSHPEICAHGEVLAPNGPLNFYGINYRMTPPLELVLLRRRDRDPVTFLHDFVWQPGERKAAGFKGKYEELLLPRYAPVLDMVARDTGIRVLHLTRSNLLERYLSQYLAVEVHGIYNVAGGPKPREDVRVRLSPIECEEDFRRTEERQARFRAMLRDHDVLELTYEQLMVDPPGTLKAIQGFIGVEERDLQTSTVKLRTRPLHEVIENQEELAAHFHGTRYAGFFERHFSSEHG